MNIDLTKYCRHGYRIEGPCALQECNELRELRAENERLHKAWNLLPAHYPFGQGGMDSDDLYMCGLAVGWRECAREFRRAAEESQMAV